MQQTKQYCFFAMSYCGNRWCSGDCDCCESYKAEQREEYEEQQREWQEIIDYERAEIELTYHINFQRVMNELLGRGCRNCWFTNVPGCINMCNYCEDCCDELNICDFSPPPPLIIPLQRHETYACAICPPSSGCTTSNSKCTHS